MIVDRSFDKRNQLTDPFGAAAHAPNDGVVGRLALVNGVHLPHHHVSAARYRVRILNAANFSLYNLELSNGDRADPDRDRERPDAAPGRARRRALIGPGERIELILDFSRLAGKRVVLQSATPQGGGGIASKTHVGPLIEFRVGERRRRHDRDPRRAAPAAGLGGRRPARRRSASGSSRSRRA